jgi:hypothetical protein
LLFSVHSSLTSLTAFTTMGTDRKIERERERAREGGREREREREKTNAPAAHF